MPESRNRDHDTETLITKPEKHITRNKKENYKGISLKNKDAKNTRKQNSVRYKNWNLSQEFKLV